MSKPQSQGGHRMKLHANAALSLRQRPADGAVAWSSDRWSISGGRVGRVSDVAQDLREVGRSLPREASEAGCWIAPRRRARSPTAPTSAGSRRSRRCAGCASPAPEIAELLEHAALDGVGRSSPGSGWAGSAGSGSSPPQRYERERPGRADPHRRQEARPDRGGAGHRVTGNRRHYTATLHRRAGRGARQRRLGVRARRDRRLHPPGLRRSARRREGHHRGRRSCAARSPSSPATASPSSAC